MPFDGQYVFIARSEQRLEGARDAGFFFDDAIDFGEVFDANDGHECSVSAAIIPLQR